MPKRISPQKTTPRSEVRSSSLNGDDQWNESPSIGHLSIEPPPRLSVVSTISSESAGRKSIRSFKSLNFRSSKEEIFDESKSFGDVGIMLLSPDDDGPGKGVSGADNITRTSPLSCVISEQALSGDLLAATQETTCQASSVCDESNQGGANLGSGGLNVGSFGTGTTSRIVPTRDSSLRRSYLDRPPHRNRKSDQSNESEERESTQLSAKNLKASRLSVSPQNGASTADEVSRRIRELKDQKRVRDYFGAVGQTDATETRASSESRRTPSPYSASPGFINKKNRDPQSNRNSECEEKEKEAVESGAPFPAIVQRIARSSSSQANSVTGRSTPAKNHPPMKLDGEPQRQSASPPKRSNSRMLKRLSRPPSPLNSERHKRTSSNTIGADGPTSISSMDKAVNSYISSTRLSQKVFHPQTGRTISFSEVGDPNGSAVLCCVGMGLTRYITALYEELALTLKLRLITPDRPGVGGSESHLDGSETPLGWPGKSSTRSQLP